MPRTIAQNEAIRVATRAKLIESATRLFAQNGYAHTSMRKIAKEADVSVGLLYHYFASKEVLLTTVAENFMRQIGENFAGIERIQDPVRQLEFLLRAIFTQLAADPLYWGLFNSMRAQPAVLTLLNEYFIAHTNTLRNTIQYLLQQGGWSNAEIEARILYSLLEGTIQQYLLDPTSYPLEQVVDRLVSMYSGSTVI